VPESKVFWHSGTDSGFRVPELVLAQLALCNENRVNIGESSFGIMALMTWFWVNLASKSRR
jgi:hypothetical protein